MADRALASAKKGALRERRTVVSVDESGFALLPAVVRSLAPRGHPPTLRFPFTRDHLSVISGITPSGQLLLRVQDHAFRSPEVVRFLQHLLRRIPGKLLVIWDGARIHRGKPIKEFLAEGAAKRLRLEQLPGYAPDLNPDGAFGRTSSTSSCVTSAVPICTTSTSTCASQRLVSATNGTSSAV